MMENKHIHETNPKRTAITLIIFVAIILVGLFTLRGPRLKYALSPQQAVEVAVAEQAVFYPYELEDVIAGTVDTIVLVDIRDRFEFGQGHIPGAENISANTLLDDKNVKRLNQLKKDGFTVVIYGEDQLQANGPWLVFQQLGYDNVRVLLGGYDYYALWKDKLADTYMDDSYMKGYARVDFAEVAASKKTDTQDNEEIARPVTVKRKKKAAVAEGGC